MVLGGFRRSPFAVPCSATTALVYLGIAGAGMWNDSADVHPVPLGAMIVLPASGSSITTASINLSYQANMVGDEQISQPHWPVGQVQIDPNKG